MPDAIDYPSVFHAFVCVLVLFTPSTYVRGNERPFVPTSTIARQLLDTGPGAADEH
jgi:hypothetical protein